MIPAAGAVMPIMPMAAGAPTVRVAYPEMHREQQSIPFGGVATLPGVQLYGDPTTVMSTGMKIALAALGIAVIGGIVVYRRRRRR